jgi:hypothetical protein
MFKLPIRTWVCNAAAVFSGQHGAVAQQAAQAGCSRETVYEHAEKVELRLADVPAKPAAPTALRADNQRLRRELDMLRRDGETRVRFDRRAQQEFATIAFAMGVSLRQIEALMETLLAGSDANVPDHSTIGRWIEAHARRAGHVLEVLDRHCAPSVQTLCLDEIFFGGDRPWSPSSRPA